MTGGYADRFARTRAPRAAAARVGEERASAAAPLRGARGEGGPMRIARALERAHLATLSR